VRPHEQGKKRFKIRALRGAQCDHGVTQFLYFALGYFVRAAAMNEYKLSDNLSKVMMAKIARRTSGRALLIAILALPLAIVAEPAPATAQLFSIPGAVFRGVFGGGYNHHYHHGGGRRHSHYERTQPTHHRHASSSVAHRSHGGGRHKAGGGTNTSSGPGSGSFH
jgi:hypothetical protein